LTVSREVRRGLFADAFALRAEPIVLAELGPFTIGGRFGDALSVFETAEPAHVARARRTTSFVRDSNALVAVLTAPPPDAAGIGFVARRVGRILPRIELRRRLAVASDERHEKEDEKAGSHDGSA